MENCQNWYVCVLTSLNKWEKIAFASVPPCRCLWTTGWEPLILSVTKSVQDKPSLAAWSPQRPTSLHPVYHTIKPSHRNLLCWPRPLGKWHPTLHILLPKSYFHLHWSTWLTQYLKGCDPTSFASLLQKLNSSSKSSNLDQIKKVPDCHLPIHLKVNSSLLVTYQGNEKCCHQWPSSLNSRTNSRTFLTLFVVMITRETLYQFVRIIIKNTR